MFHKPASGLSGIVFLVLCAPFAAAQDFHVNTQISDLKGRKPQSAGACDSLFHAGKVYDYVRGINQVTIYEPAQSRFVIVDAGRSMATRISFDEITDRLTQDRANTQAFLATADRSQLTPERENFIRFQLKPVFHQIKFHADARPPLLVMTSPLVEYRVECSTDARPETVKAYLDYADWAARLSFVSRRQAKTFPDARLAVNEELRRRHLLPVKVTLLTRDADGVHAQADHKFGWELIGDNKKTISHWDAKAASKSTKYVDWDEFLKATVATVKR